SDAPTINPGEELDLSVRPTIIFQVFGSANDPRMVPIAALRQGALVPIVLRQQGWHHFDAMYFHPGAIYPLYADGRLKGTVTVRRGMWTGGGNDPLYTLPGCQTLTPLAAVTLSSTSAPTAFTVEYLAASTPVIDSQRPAAPATATLPAAETERIARTVAARVAQDFHINVATLDSLDFHALSFPSGVGTAPTIVASFIDPEADNPASLNVRTTHLLLIANRDSTGAYVPTFIHRVNGALADAEFRRFVDHLDLTGDGVDEIVLEGWHFGGAASLTILGWRDGKWVTVHHTRPTWCLDDAPSK
ncbi:MAG: hypothetical protein IRY91_16670, partial [Gemmatimonadaceae bacterium]|nr:hypothetical protein [Gemmatimonadaceae bacterium]